MKMSNHGDSISSGYINFLAPASMTLDIIAKEGQRDCKRQDNKQVLNNDNINGHVNREKGKISQDPTP